MGGPTNTQPRYRPPPPGMAPPPPPTASNDGPFMGGQPPQQQHHQQHQQHQQQQGGYHNQQNQQQQGGYGQVPQQSYYSQQPPQQQQQQQQHYYAQQQPPQQQPQQQHQHQGGYNQVSQQQQPSSASSYAARSAAAHSPHGSQHGNINPSANTNMNASHHSNASANAATANNNNNTSTNKNDSHLNPTGETPAQAAAQSRLLTNATQRVTESSYYMQRAMENNDVCTTLEKACLLLEELGDPNHGVHHRPSAFANGGPGAGAASGYAPYPPSYYSAASGAFPPSGYYGDRPSPPPSGAGGGAGGGGGSNNYITPLSPKNYYELHMRAMDEMPNLEEFLLGLCHVRSSIGIGGAASAGGVSGSVGGGPTNAPSHAMGGMMNNGAMNSFAAPYTSQELYEAVQYCPRVVPRLYLQICMGSVSIRAGSVPAVQVMEELGEAAKCVQCPVRGLFLRHYLLLALKDKLPDGKLDGEQEGKVGESGDGGDVAVKGGSGNEEGDLFMTPVEDAGVVAGPTSPPPPLPPPPPPTDDVPLFPDSMEDSPLFAGISETPAPAAKPAPAKQPAAEDTTTNAKEDPSKPRTGTVRDSYEFILQNLVQMNRLWVRIQHLPGTERTKENKRRRERERNELRVLVGTNLVRLSQLEGISAHTYGSIILPRILEEVASCRDALAQAYLMDCIIQVFPDEFHMETLEIFLGVLPKLKDKVNARTILNNMMERLLHYYQDELLLHDEVDTNDVKRIMLLDSFDMFEICVQRVFQARGMNIPPKDVIRLQGALLGYALKIAPGNVGYISRCIGNCARELASMQAQKKAAMMGQGIVVGGGTKRSGELDMEEVAITELEKLLSVPLDSMALKVLELPDFSSLLAFLPWENRRKVAVSMVKGVVMGGDATKIKDAAEAEQLFAIIAPLLREEGDAPPAMSSMYGSRMEEGGSLISRTANLMGTLGISSSAMQEDPMFAPNIGSMHGAARNFGGDPVKAAQFHEEQVLVAKLIHVMDHEDTDVAYQMLNVARKHIQPGGVHRTTVTLHPIVFAALRLLCRVQELEYPKPIPAPAEEKEEEKEVFDEEVKKNDVEGDSEKKDAGECDADEEKEASHKKAETNDLEDDTEKKDAGEGATDNNNEKESASIDEKDQKESEEGIRNDAKVENDTNLNAAVAEDSPPLFAAFAKSVNCRKILVFLQKSVAMISPNNPELGFKLYLEIAVATDLLAYSTQPTFQSASSEFSSISYDFMTQALLVYEDEISESKVQIQAITSMVGSLLSCRTFERTDYEALITKTAQYAAKLLKKPDQCRMVCLCSRLFYVGGKDEANTYRNPQRVLECLQRGLKIADACSMASSSNVQLFVEILDYYVYFYEIENPVITDKFVTGLIALVNEHLDSAGVTGSAAISETRAYYGEILKKIKRKKTEKETAERFGKIIC